MDQENEFEEFHESLVGNELDIEEEHSLEAIYVNGGLDQSPLETEPILLPIS